MHKITRFLCISLKCKHFFNSIETRPMPDTCNFWHFLSFLFQILSFPFQVCLQKCRKDANEYKRKKNDRKSYNLMAVLAFCMLHFIRRWHEFWHVFECQVKTSRKKVSISIIFFSPFDRFFFSSCNLFSHIYVQESSRSCSLHFGERKQR